MTGPDGLVDALAALAPGLAWLAGRRPPSRATARARPRPPAPRRPPRAGAPRNLRGAPGRRGRAGPCEVAGGWGLGLLALVLGGLAGCAAVHRPVLDPAPGHHVVLGRLDLSRFEVPEGILEIVREDGTFEEAVRAGELRREFALTLPPGRYRVVRLRAFRDGRAVPTQAVWDLEATFEVGGAPAVYVGTLEVTAAPGSRPRLRVLDQYADTLGVLRGQYADLPAAVARRLMVVGP